MPRRFRFVRPAVLLAFLAASPVSAEAPRLSVAWAAEGARSIEGGAVELSGITWAGGDLYYAVDDADGKLYPITLPVRLADGGFDPADVVIGAGVPLSGASDPEGCAFDPLCGTVWVSDEEGATIREFRPATGERLRSAPVPEVFRRARGNFSLESLTISGDGLTMWTANEEALSCDGPRSTPAAGCLVRLARFARASAEDGWTPAGQWAYRTDPVHATGEDFRGGRCSGVSGLVALPDGGLLVLEREMSVKSRVFGKVPRPSCRLRLYAVDFRDATDVSGIESLAGAEVRVVAKGNALYDNGSVESPSNYEAICQGPRLDGGDTALVLVSDAGHMACPAILTLRLRGNTAAQERPRHPVAIQDGNGHP